MQIERKGGVCLRVCACGSWFRIVTVFVVRSNDSFNFPLGLIYCYCCYCYGVADCNDANNVWLCTLTESLLPQTARSRSATVRWIDWKRRATYGVADWNDAGSGGCDTDRLRLRYPATGKAKTSKGQIDRQRKVSHLWWWWLRQCR